MLSFEVARQLSQTNIRVLGLVLIDSPFPVDHEPLSEPIIRHMLKESEFEPSPLIINEFLSNARLLEQYNLEGPNLSIKAAILHCQNEIDTEAICGHGYTWLSDQAERQKSLDNWRQLLNHHSKVVPLPGNHFDIFNPTNVSVWVPTSSLIFFVFHHLTPALLRSNTHLLKFEQHVIL